MRVFYLVLFIVVFGISCMAQSYRCLPSDVKASDIVEVRRITSKAGKDITERVSVKAKLDKMRARCTKGTLVDRNGRQIIFYPMQGCWGNPPADYIEIMKRQRREIDQLKKRYTVIEMSCDRGGPLPQ